MCNEMLRAIEWLLGKWTCWTLTSCHISSVCLFHALSTCSVAFALELASKWQTSSLWLEVPMFTFGFDPLRCKKAKVKNFNGFSDCHSTAKRPRVFCDVFFQLVARRASIFYAGNLKHFVSGCVYWKFSTFHHDIEIHAGFISDPMTARPDCALSNFSQMKFPEPW